MAHDLKLQKNSRNVICCDVLKYDFLAYDLKRYKIIHTKKKYIVRISAYCIYFRIFVYISNKQI